MVPYLILLSVVVLVPGKEMGAFWFEVHIHMPANIPYVQINKMNYPKFTQKQKQKIRMTSTLLNLLHMLL